MNEYQKEWVDIFIANVTELAKQGSDFCDCVITTLLFDIGNLEIIDKTISILQKNGFNEERIQNIMQNISMNPNVLGKIANEKGNIEIYNKMVSYGN